VPNCVSYDPCFGHELAVIVQDGLRRMYAEGERVFYYLTLMNEAYPQPALPAGAEEGIKKGLYLLESREHASVQLLGSGVILREVIEAARLLQQEYNIAANVWSATSFTELARDGMACEHHNRLHPLEEPRLPWVTRQLLPHQGVVLAATDYQRLYSEQIRPYLPDHRPYVTLGTDGFGRSDTRSQLRSFFGVNAASIVVATLKLLADEGDIDPRLVRDALSSFEFDPTLPPPWLPQPVADHAPDAAAPPAPEPVNTAPEQRAAALKEPDGDSASAENTPSESGANPDPATGARP
jgi:pyruvate dehydrogenase E1 component